MTLMPRATSCAGVGRRLPTPTLPAACSIAASTSCSQSCSHSYLVCVPTEFPGKDARILVSIEMLMECQSSVNRVLIEMSIKS